MSNRKPEEHFNRPVGLAGKQGNTCQQGGRIQRARRRSWSAAARVALCVSLFGVLGLLLSACGGGGLSEEELLARMEALIGATPATSPAASSTSEDFEKVIRAGNFELVDEEGNVRATLRFLDDGSPSLALIDDQGTNRVWLFLVEDGSPWVVLKHHPTFLLEDEAGKPRSSQALGEDESPTFSFIDAAGVSRSMLSLGEDGSPGLSFNDSEGEGIWSAP